MECMVKLSRDEINALQYPVVVEMWKHVVDQGSKRRLWLAEFNSVERVRAAKWYQRFCRWYLVTGAPDHVVIHPRTLLWLRHRLIPFFGTL